MVSEVKDVSGLPVIKLTSAKQTDDVICANPVIVYGGFLGQNSDSTKVFLAAASQVDIQFAILVAHDSNILDDWGFGGNIVLIKHGRYIWYHGGSETEDIVSWVKKYTVPPIDVASVEQAKEVITANNAVVFGYFADRNTDREKIFLKVAEAIYDEVFAIVSDNKVIAELEAEDQDVVIFKKFDENRVKYEDEAFTEDLFKRWVVQETTPVLYLFSGKRSDKLNVVPFPMFPYDFYLYLSKENGDFVKYIDLLKPVVKKYRDKIPMSSAVDADEKQCEMYLELRDVKKEEVPCIRLIANDKESQGKRYKLPSNRLNPESVEEFIESVLAGKVEPHWKQQELPADWDKNPVKVLVASNFDEVVNDPTKKVLVDFFAAWCGPCVLLEPIFDKLGEYFEKDDDVVIAKMDSFNNELKHLKMLGVPTIRLYGKDNQVREYSGDRTLEDLIKFVENDGVEQSDDEPASSEVYA